MKPWKFLPKLRGGDEVPSEIAELDQAHSEEAVPHVSKVDTDEAMEVPSELAGGDEVVSKHVPVIKLRLSKSEKEFKSKHGFAALLVASGGYKVEVSANKAGLKGIGS